MGGKPGFSQADGKGNIWVNIEDTNEIIQIDAKNAVVVKRYSIAWHGSHSNADASPASHGAPQQQCNCRQAGRGSAGLFRKCGQKRSRFQPHM